MQEINELESAVLARPLVPRAIRTADAMVDLLLEAGVDAVFGLPGGAISPMHDALLDRPQVRVIHTRHEGGAMFAAAGYARATGKLAVVLVTSGPGVLNAMTGLASAHCDCLPVLLIAGEVPRHRYGRGALQEGSTHGLDVLNMARAITKLACEVHHPDAAVGIVRHAIHTALSGRPGPVLLTLPMDVGTAQVEQPRLSGGARVEYQLDLPSVLAATTAIERCKRPVLFAGTGARHGAGPQRVRELAERLQCPVMTTPKAKGVFPESHPLSLGVFGFGGHPSASDYLQEGIDGLLAVGTGLSETASNGWSPLLRPSDHFIQIDVDPLRFGRSYPLTAGLIGDAPRVLEVMVAHLGAGDRAPRTYGVRRHADPTRLVHGSEGRISPPRAIWELQQAMPVDTLFSLDIGEHTLFGIHYLSIDNPQAFLLMSGLGSMGSGVGGAVGLKVAYPKRPVVAVCGDGCFSMALGEIAVAAREQLPLVVAVVNDQRFGMCEIGHEAVYGRRPPYPAGPLDIPRLSRSLGAQAFAVEHAGDLLALDLPKRLERGPIVLDIQIDRSVRMPSSARNDFLTKARSQTVQN